MATLFLCLLTPGEETLVNSLQYINCMRFPMVSQPVLRNVPLYQQLLRHLAGTERGNDSFTYVSKVTEYKEKGL